MSRRVKARLLLFAFGWAPAYNSRPVVSGRTESRRQELSVPKLTGPRTRLVIHDLSRRNGQANFAADVLSGLSATPKHLFAKYLYDELGSQLFEAICRVDEYYLTRAESEILSRHADEIISLAPAGETLVELASGIAEMTPQANAAPLRTCAEFLFYPVNTPP